MIGCWLFPDKSDNMVSVRRLPLLADLDSCKKLSWDSAVRVESKQQDNKTSLKNEERKLEEQEMKKWSILDRISASRR
ncbi:hypothetical protein PIB30_081466 [Stylosanthes scabra]|uniref:Uncharacterized protein n=1 Tax=Stylosanthes scabra TaxID=79078 RepID=A0ABU6STX7_9FABA|nr:hypothetical protein [Stylosanthes scabra]